MANIRGVIAGWPDAEKEKIAGGREGLVEMVEAWARLSIESFDRCEFASAD
jgi:hypothetical protein